MADHGLFDTHTSSISLDFERSLIAGREGREVFNDCGFVVRARATNGEDIHLWMFIYQQKGPEVILDGNITQTLLVTAKFPDGEEKTIRDRPYVNKGQNIDDYLPYGSMKVTETDDQVEWTNGGRVFVCKPPNWHVKGTHAGVTVDLHFRQRGQAFYHCGRFETLKEREGMAGYIVHTFVKGTVEVGGRTLEIEHGYGVHERIIMAGTVPPRIDYMTGRGSNWIHGFGERLSWYMLNADSSSTATFMVNVDGKTLVCQGRRNAWAEEADYWLDPKTNQMNPCKWHIYGNVESGRLEATVTGYGRGFYTWIRRNGTLLVHQYVAGCKAKFTRNDGTVIEEDQVASLEYMRTLYRQTTS